jgi:hypothetical protein
MIAEATLTELASLWPRSWGKRAWVRGVLHPLGQRSRRVSRSRDPVLMCSLALRLIESR